jgi:hypothetical protein
MAHVAFIPALNYVRVDFHGCSADDAGREVKDKVKEVYSFAVSFLEFVHGTPDSDSDKTVSKAVQSSLSDPSVGGFITATKRVRLEPCNGQLVRRLRDRCPDKELVVLDGKRVVAEEFGASSGILCRIIRRYKPAVTPAILSSLYTWSGAFVAPYPLPFMHRRPDNSIPDDFELFNLEPSSDIEFHNWEQSLEPRKRTNSIEFSPRELRRLQIDVGTKLVVHYRVRDNASYSLAHEICEQLLSVGWTVEKAPESAKSKFTAASLSESSEKLRDVLEGKERIFRLFDTGTARHLYFSN